MLVEILRDWVKEVVLGKKYLELEIPKEGVGQMSGLYLYLFIVI